MKHKICVITGSRAEYGLLKNIMNRIKSHNNLSLQLIVTGMHTSEKYGETFKNILNDDFYIDAIIKMNLNNDSPEKIVYECGLELKEFSKIYSKLNPDMILVLGDRYEIFISVFAAVMFNIPISHICGGDITEYLYDDCIRNSISKMAHLHFTSHESSTENLIKMGENNKNIFCYGNPGLEDLYNFIPLDKISLTTYLNINFAEYNFLFVYHPVTLTNKNIISDVNIIKNILTFYLEKLNHNIFIIYPNSDTYNSHIFSTFDHFIHKYPNCFGFKSLDRYIYLSLAYHMNLFIGNSSSGIYEMPLLKIPVLNIGNRQKGRLLSNGILSCDLNKDLIINNINKLLSMDKSNIYPIYKSYNSSELIVDKIFEKIQNISLIKNT